MIIIPIDGYLFCHTLHALHSSLDAMPTGILWCTAWVVRCRLHGRPSGLLAIGFLDNHFFRNMLCTHRAYIDLTQYYLLLYYIYIASVLRPEPSRITRTPYTACKRSIRPVAVLGLTNPTTTTPPPPDVVCMQELKPGWGALAPMAYPHPSSFFFFLFFRLFCIPTFG